MPSPTQVLGKTAEAVAAKSLIAKGFTLVKHNYHAVKGEVDLIMKNPDGEWHLFEVKFRKNYSFGHIRESVSPAKIEKVMAAAGHFFLHDQKLDQEPYYSLGIVFVSPGKKENTYRCEIWETIDE